MSWDQVLRLLAVAPVAYVGVVVLIRVSGKRSLAKFNAFDFIVTIALGSMLATILLSEELALVTGLVAFGILLGLQYLATLGIRRWGPVEKAAKSNPSILLSEGVMLEEELAAARVTDKEVLAAVRAAGYGDTILIAAVVLETDGTLSVIPMRHFGDGSALSGAHERASPPEA